MVEQFSHLGVPSEVLEALDDIDIERYVWRHAVLPDPVVGQCLGGGNSRRGVHVEHLANEILGLGSDLGPRVSLEVLLQARLGLHDVVEDFDQEGAGGARVTTRPW